jgi:hypothetical protein
MRYRRTVFVVLMLLALLTAINLQAAPVPDPSAILSIGPPPKGIAAAEHCKDVISRLTKHPGFIWYAGIQPEVSRLPSVISLKDAAHPWLEKNLRVTQEDGGRRLRLTFRAGNRAEQVTILNTLLRIYIQWEATDRIKVQEEALRWKEDRIVELEKRIESGQARESADSYRKGINDLRANRIPALRSEIDRLKQVTVIKWAK